MHLWLLSETYQLLRLAEIHDQEQAVALISAVVGIRSSSRSPLSNNSATTTTFSPPSPSRSIIILLPFSCRSLLSPPLLFSVWFDLLFFLYILFYSDSIPLQIPLSSRLSICLFSQAPYFHPRSQRVLSNANQPEELGATHRSIHLKKASGNPVLDEKIDFALCLLKIQDAPEAMIAVNTTPSGSILNRRR